jgi:hypothetical protein
MEHRKKERKNIEKRKKEKKEKALRVSSNKWEVNIQRGENTSSLKIIFM